MLCTYRDQANEDLNMYTTDVFEPMCKTQIFPNTNKPGDAKQQHVAQTWCGSEVESATNLHDQKTT